MVDAKRVCCQPERGLVLRDVTLTAGSTCVLRDASLTVPLSGMTLLSGRNGAGKSTLLRAMLGLIPLQGGEILTHGLPPAQARQHIGYMPQSVTDAALLLPAVSHVRAAVDGLRWGLPLRLRPRREEADRLLALTGASAFAHRPLGLLSGGERQRVGLAQALAGKPDLLLLDEPLAALDQAGQEQTVRLLTDLTERLGIGIVLTSHETEALAGAVTRVVQLADGGLHVRV
ncbi:ATP-binding cassette domain-containing protein [Gluconobacter sp. R75690]|uniref:ATP-binding cassette domain-containing protein n=1 Tax=Gluconobacter TaxID=441 RepID=UPI00188D0EC4|nr:MULTISPECIES: ATP-binding cassette domain-containing protein [unclassified Gluconobacter]MBF0849891.1 ATP-binding cassette domain-containing protein [Gluconobacter sp. R75690]MBF0878662.1 ATP-binding cassette domain-containing protein [Gluconobacter sp. R75828]